MSNNLPIYPLLRKDRNVDIIVCFDASADIKQENWLSVVESYAKQRGVRGWPVGAGWPRAKDETRTELDAADAATARELFFRPYHSLLHYVLGAGYLLRLLRLVFWLQTHPTREVLSRNHSEQAAGKIAETREEQRGRLQKNTKDPITEQETKKFGETNLGYCNGTSISEQLPPCMY